MFNWFKKTSEKDKLQARYRKLLGEAHKLSQVNRSQGDAKYAEAEAVLQQLKTLEQAS
ncbi:Lacal_2735 family protein [Robiginitalea sp. M366]|uniref:Lacal_2735 family protein n=1 Tax=Robiginitalea aestuariiviva TaxID=3036903 RepID=UPI00240DE6D0|nr:Lacal_2735 family protein [Robiginitalea aestuariiviva]MDG1570840.1 Lacal_2735 family protein [Robiginitalea aestuariiviva]